jgi:NAD(P)-dependent dehydrogenase (short-subunit alcohol dehydrogenase family)
VANTGRPPRFDDPLAIPASGVEAAHRARRLGTPEELAAAAVFLCSQAAGYVTGQSPLVDGGLTRSW